MKEKVYKLTMQVTETYTKLITAKSKTEAKRKGKDIVAETLLSFDPSLYHTDNAKEWKGEKTKKKIKILERIDVSEEIRNYVN